MERWKYFRGIYWVSNTGRVKSIKPGGRERILKACKNGNGYNKVYLMLDGFRCPFFIHRLVGEVWIRRSKENQLVNNVVNHIDGDKTNNSVDNLEWVSYSDNTKHWHRCLKKVKNGVA